MADPILPGFYKCMVVFQGRSGLPEDRFVNNWIFRDDGGPLLPIDPANDAIKAIMDAFYFTAAANGTKLSTMMSSVISGVQYRLYDLGQEPPREPLIQSPAVTPQWASGANLPQEMAVTLSLRTTKRGPRGRGRLYLGPLLQSAVASTINGVTVAEALRTTIIDRANNVLNNTRDVTWCVLSQMDQQCYEVTGGYVDDAFDVQRRRGQAPVARTIFGSYSAVQ